MGGLRVLPQPFALVPESRLLLICTCDGTVTGFGLAGPKLSGEREQARQTLRDQPGPERQGGRVSAGLRARIVPRLHALNAAIWHNQMTAVPVKRTLIAYDH
jgi:hypothetical protein